jgi:hypothetical protein
MSEIEITFDVPFADYSLPRPTFGPKFSRFLPYGENETIDVPLGHQNYSLCLWFERHGRLDETGWIQFDQEGVNGFSDEHILRQAVIDGGHLYGRLLARNVAQDVVDAMENRAFGNEDYMAFARQSVDLILPPCRVLVRILKNEYGQYWIPEDVLSWNSRNRSLGYFCSRVLNMQWRIHGAGKFQHFVPTVPTMTFTKRPLEFHLDGEYIDATDWNQIKEAVSRGTEPAFFTEVMVRAHRMLDNRDIRGAVVETSTALELAIDSLMRLSTVTAKELARFFQLDVKSRFLVIASLRQIDRSSIDNVCKLLRLRNKIVHEGATVEKEVHTLVTEVLVGMRKWAPGAMKKFPVVNHGNKRISLDGAEEILLSPNFDTWAWDRRKPLEPR